MDKRSYFIEAIQADAFIYKDWVISVFTQTDFPRLDMGEIGDSRNYPYRLFALDDEGEKIGFLDPTSKTSVVVLDGFVKNKPALDYNDRFVIKPGELPNVTGEINTRVGNVFLNAVLLTYNFGPTVPFMVGRLRGSDFDKEVVKRLVDEPADGAVAPEGTIPVSQLVKYQDAVMYLSQFGLVCAPGCSPKSLVPNPIVTKRRNELMKQHGENIRDPAILAQVEAELVKLDRESFKDDPAYGFVAIGKSFPLTRKKKFTMIGMEEGFGDYEIITKPLLDGFDPKNMPAYTNTLRSGSHSRGALTALSGVEVKRANQIFQSVKIVEDDCGVKYGKKILVDQPGRLNGIWVIVNGKPVQQTVESAMAFNGKLVEIRTPQTCQTKAPNFCAKCVGRQIAFRPDGVHVTIGGPNSVMMYAFMGAMHGKTLTTQRYDIATAFM